MQAKFFFVDWTSAFSSEDLWNLPSTPSSDVNDVLREFLQFDQPQLMTVGTSSDVLAVCSRINSSCIILMTMAASDIEPAAPKETYATMIVRALLTSVITDIYKDILSAVT